MPRPQGAASSAATSKGGNPFRNWMEKRKNAQRDAAEKAAKQVTNDTAKNENLIIDTLNSIDFLHSKLSQEVLDRKSNEKQPYGDLELAQRALINKISKNPQSISIDIRKIDEKILTLVYRFKEAVELGDEKTAYAAKAALWRAVNDIRLRIPQNKPELSAAFVEANSVYLDSWLNLVEQCYVADRAKQNLTRLQDQLKAKEAEVEASKDELYNKIQGNPEWVIALDDMQMHDLPEDRMKWSKIQKDLHKMMITERMRQSEFGLQEAMVYGEEMLLEKTISQIELLFAKASKQPIVTDPNLMNKYKEEVERLFADMAKSDAELDEHLRSLDDIDGRLKQMEEAPGSVRAKEVAAEQAEAAIKEIRKRQEVQSGNLAKEAADRLKAMGIMNEEELQLRKEENDRIQQQIYEDMVQNIVEDDREVLYN